MSVGSVRGRRGLAGREALLIAAFVVAIGVIASLVGFGALEGRAKPPSTPGGIACDAGEEIVVTHNTLADPPPSGLPQTPEDAIQNAFAADPEAVGTVPDPAELVFDESVEGDEHFKHTKDGKKTQIVKVKPHGDGWVVSDWVACASSLGKKS